MAWSAQNTTGFAYYVFPILYLCHIRLLLCLSITLFESRATRLKGEEPSVAILCQEHPFLDSSCSQAMERHTLRIGLGQIQQDMGFEGMLQHNYIGTITQ